MTNGREDDGGPGSEVIEVRLTKVIRRWTKIGEKR